MIFDRNDRKQVIALLGAGSMGTAIVRKIAARGKTSAQVILRWHLQAGNIAIPGSSNEAHIQENFEIFDFELTDEEMQRLTEIDKDERFADY